MRLPLLLERRLTEQYEGEWEANIVSGSLPEGSHVGYQSGYEMRIGDRVAELDHGIRGKNFPHNVRVVGNKVYLSYVKR